MQDGENASQGVAQATETESGSGREADLTKAIADLRAEIDRRFEGVSAKLQSFRDPPKPAVEPTSTPVAHVQNSIDVQGEIKLDRIVRSLPEAAQAKLDEMATSGSSLKDRLAVAELLRSLAPSNGAQPTVATPVPSAHAATQAHRQAQAHPRTMSEYVALAAKARQDPEGKAAAQWEALKADATFDPTKLTDR